MLNQEVKGRSGFRTIYFMPSLIPLVASLVFGLVTASFVVLLVLPAIYAILDDLGLSTLTKT